ncbi:MAG: diguanylate cyclase [Acidobacteria bacterium]|nr:diguanylate cyclase [Acidobacteriota bacterium]
MNGFDLSNYQGRNKILWWLIGLSGSAALLASFLQLNDLSQTQAWQSLCLLMMIGLVGRLAFVMPSSSGVMAPTDALIFLAAFSLGTPVATIGAASNGFITAWFTARKRTECFYQAGTQAVATFLASTLFYKVINHNALTPLQNLTTKLPPLELFLTASVALIAVYFFSNSVLTALFQAWRQNHPTGQFWINHYLWSALHIFTTGFITTIVFILVHASSPLYLLALVPMMLASFAACRTYFTRVEAASTNLAEVNRLHFATVEALATAIDAKDQVTHEHVRRVQIYAEGLGRLFNLPELEIEALRAGALLHDIGKLAVPDHILNKPGKLTPAEFEKMKIHTTIGARILERVGFPYPVVPIVRYHHERWDGKGYPEGLSGTNIPLTARILAVVDCFDAVREDRAYRCAFSREDACQLLLQQSGKHFDPEVVETFLLHLATFEDRIIAAGLSLEPAQSNLFLPENADANAVAANRVSDQPEYLDQIAAAHHEMSSLYEIARTFSTSLNLEDTVSIFANKLKYVIPFETCAIYLYDEQKQLARAEHVTGKFADAFLGRQVMPGDGVTGWVLANRKMFCNAHPELDLASLNLDADTFKTLAVAPLLKGEHLIGLIALYSEKLMRYSTDHIRMLETISGLAADSIYNALHHAETREFALTDPLTGMPNARSLFFQFAQESNRANRQGTPLSVLMMDLDGFKKINDTYGHHAGNEFLIGIAQVIVAELRSYDYLARYAGDEFVALLPGATESDVEDLMWRVQRAVEDYTLPIHNGQRVNAGVSLGTARYGIEADSLERLLKIADRRMYKNKQLRRQHEFLMEAGEFGDAVAQVIARS